MLVEGCVRAICCVVRNALCWIMIKSFRHKGLRLLFETGRASGVQPSHTKRLRLQLGILDTARTISDVDLPGFALHALKGTMQNRWAISVSGNWRLTFEFTAARRMYWITRIITNGHAQSTSSR